MSISNSDPNPELSYRIFQMTGELANLRIYDWLSYDFGTWHWYILLAMFFLPIVFLYLYIDRKQLPELTMFGAFIAIIAITFDEIGYELGFWTYQVKLVPIIPRLTAIDYSALPIIYIFIYQTFRTWRSFIIALMIAALIFSFMLEPFIVWAGFYKIITWKYFYGFPIYITIGIAMRYVTKKIFEISQKHGR